LADTAGEVREILQVLNQHARDYHLLMLEIWTDKLMYYHRIISFNPIYYVVFRLMIN
jgi:hypothetical protein